MSDKPPFDATRAAFYLIAFVIGVYALVIVGGMVACLYYAETIIKDPSVMCDPKGRLNELLTAALAAALAVYSGNSRKS